MSKLLISTSCRHTKENEPSGYLYVYDICENRIIRKSNIIEHPYISSDPNPRGGFRGLKGISIFDNHIALSNASSIFLYDNNWHPVTYFWNPICAGIHEIKLFKDHIWITSARNDLLICLDFYGNILEYYDVRRLLRDIHLPNNHTKPFLTRNQILEEKYDFRNPQSHDSSFTDNLHVNGFAQLENSDLLISCGLIRNVKNKILHNINNLVRKTFIFKKFPNLMLFYKKAFSHKNWGLHQKNKKTLELDNYSCLIRLTRDGKVYQSINFPFCSVPSLSIYILHDKSAIYLNTTAGKLFHFNPYNNDIYSISKIGNNFLRGAFQLSDDTLVLGDNNELIQFDLYSKKVVNRAVLSKIETEGIFDIKILPRNFHLPPLSFIEHHKQILPINQK